VTEATTIGCRVFSSNISATFVVAEFYDCHFEIDVYGPATAESSSKPDWSDLHKSQEQPLARVKCSCPPNSPWWRLWTFCRLGTLSHVGEFLQKKSLCLCCFRTVLVLQSLAVIRTDINSPFRSPAYGWIKWVLLLLINVEYLIIRIKNYWN